MGIVTDKHISIVSGLPRSGTSMMMRMLAAGGMPILTDNIRKADEDNPYGYYELEKVKQLTKDASWLNQASGKAFKAVYLLLYELPPSNEYRVIFMKRRLDEIVASQNVMLQRQQKQGGTLDNEALMKAFQQHLEKLDTWLRQQKNFEVLYISYNDLLVDPERSIREVTRFLGQDLDREAMIKVVNPALYRQRK